MGGTRGKDAVESIGSALFCVMSVVLAFCRGGNGVDGNNANGDGGGNDLSVTLSLHQSSVPPVSVVPAVVLCVCVCVRV